MPGQSLPEIMKNTTPADQFATKKSDVKMETESESIAFSQMQATDPTLKIAEPSDYEDAAESTLKNAEPTITESDPSAKYPYERTFY